MTVTVAIPRLRELIVERLSQLFTAEHAEKMADAFLFGELVGRSTHGIIRLLPGRKGAVDEEPGPDPVIERTAPLPLASTAARGCWSRHWPRTWSSSWRPSTGSQW